MDYTGAAGHNGFIELLLDRNEQLKNLMLLLNEFQRMSKTSLQRRKPSLGMSLNVRPGKCEPLSQR